MYDSFLRRLILFRGRGSVRCGELEALYLLFRVLPVQDFYSVARGYFLTFDIVFCSYDVVFYSCDWDLFRGGFPVLASVFSSNPVSFF